MTGLKTVGALIEYLSEFPSEMSLKIMSRTTGDWVIRPSFGRRSDTEWYKNDSLHGVGCREIGEPWFEIGISLFSRESTEDQIN